MGTGTALTGTGGVLLTTLLGTSLLGDAPVGLDDLNLPIESVNVDNALLGEWMSESIESFSDEPLNGECTFFNFTKSYESEFCDAFTISRMQSGTIASASARALKCAAKASSECILSPEVGLAVPAAFLSRQNEDKLKVVIAPRRVAFKKGDPIPEKRNVRVNSIDLFSSKTILMNSSVRVEYLSADKRVHSDVFKDDEAFCINLLRVAFESDCWRKLDG